MRDQELKKTLTYMLVAGIAVLVAWEPWAPAPADFSVPQRVGQKLFPEFTDPLAAENLEIVTFDEETASVRDFRVAEKNGVWTIPSHNGYPADAKEHMAQAATALMDITILTVASDMQGDQKLFGVITPDPEKLKVGMTGVGTRVTVRDAKEKVLADLVIGEAVKDAPQLRYVREVGRDPIYTVRINPSEFSTKFGDWIEKDLLKLNAFDVREVELNDYSTRSGVTADGRQAWQIDKRSEIDLAYDDAKSEWSLLEMKEFDDQRQPQTVTLTADEQLDSQKLNDMRTALDDLQIIDVERKPTGLSQDLKVSDELSGNPEALVSLAERGFLYGALPGEEPQIYSSEGEVTATTKDGVKYILRFGDLAGVSEEPSSDEATDEPGAEPKSTGPSRFLLVTAQFDESVIPKPELQPIPGEEEAEKPAEESAEEEQPSEDKPAEEEKAEAAADDAKPAEEAAEESKPAEEKPADEKPAEESVPETKTAAQQDDAAAKDEPQAESAAEEAPAEEKPASEEQPAAEPAEEEPAETKPATPEEQEKIRVRQENKRKQDEYDAAVKRGQDKVQELNERFADWYYIISDDVYKKIHLGRKDIIQQKEKSTEDLGNLKQLEQGLGTPPAQPAIP